MFRRLVSYKENPKGATSLEKFLALPSKKHDLVIHLAAFKKLTPKQRMFPTKTPGVPLVKLQTLVSSGNRLDPKPETLVFVEEPATLKNNKGNVKSWNDQGQPVKKI